MLATRRMWIIVTGVMVFFITVMTAQAAPPAQGDANRGKYLVNVAGCWGCHGQSLAGYKADGPTAQPASAPFGQAFSGPFGFLPAANISSDKDTGIGGWTDAEIEQAIRAGKNKNGRQLHPIMPYPNFAGLAEQDMKDLIAFLRSTPGVNNAVPATQLNGPAPAAPPGRGFPPVGPTSGSARGEYLVMNVAGCGDCHTPSNAQGAPDRTKWLAGNIVPTAEGFQTAPNLTPDQKTGIGAWTEAQIAQTLRTGERPGKGPVMGLMAEVVGIGHPAYQGFGYSQMTELDRLAIAQYLKTIPAVENLPQPPAAPPAQPTVAPTTASTAAPTTAATTAPTAAATTAPTTAPTAAATVPAPGTTSVPTSAPTGLPTGTGGGGTVPGQAPSAGGGGAAPPMTMPETGSLPTLMIELFGGLGALVSFLAIAWRRARM